MRKLGKLLIRIISLYYFIKAILALKEIALILLPGVKGNSNAFAVLGINGLTYFLVNFIVILIIAVLLWIFTDKIVATIIGEDSNDGLNINLHYEELFSITLFVLGIIFVIDAIPSVLSQVQSLFTVNMQSYPSNFRLSIFVGMLAPILKLVVGICLIIKNRIPKKGI
ncbi:hypothetical protein SH1V18_35620 [Vallitalea longa]|uniref:Uncharacterized protein n=1 Tax=Vallitalea longa TaxID=2936439 RepID=A0A9W6DH12_9FIRM|nr:hypothetical protein [Vallitalea longa]GKX31082.1 hypothetical protein SH1V18_35620 [Vallitalea longa]